MPYICIGVRLEIYVPLQVTKGLYKSGAQFLCFGCILVNGEEEDTVRDCSLAQVHETIFPLSFPVMSPPPLELGIISLGM